MLMQLLASAQGIPLVRDRPAADEQDRASTKARIVTFGVGVPRVVICSILNRSDGRGLRC